MPINHLESFLAERKQTQTLPLNTLSDSRLGIDGAAYINLLLQSPATREPLLSATGGSPLTLSTRIEADLRALDKHRIKPVFVFPGLSPNKRHKAHFPTEFSDACRDRREAWSKYESGLEDQATRLFDGRSCIQHWDLWRMVLRIFRHRNVEFLVAPYLPWAQLIYLLKHPRSYIHAIYASTDALLFLNGVEKLITSLDMTSANPSFSFVVKPKLLAELGLSEDQFLDAGILAGFEHSLPFPVIAADTSLKSTADMVKYYKTGFATVSNFGDNPAAKAMGYIDHFARTRTMIKFSLILSLEGSVIPLPFALSTLSQPTHHGHHLTAADIPSDLHEVFTHRLPDEIHFYLSRGLLGPQVLNWLTSGYIYETPPLDNGDTTEYKRFVKEVITEGQTGPRATALALISSVINQFWINRRIQGCFWFEPPSGPNNQKTNAISHNSRETAALADRVAGWNVTYNLVEEELRRQNVGLSSTIDFALALGATSTEKLANRTRNRGNNPSGLDKKDEIVGNVIFRFMELRGFLLNSHMHTALARGMHLALKQTRVNDKFQDPLYLFLELARAGVLHGNLWSGRAYSGGPSFGTDEEKKCMLLVMRVLSILPLTFKPQPWQAPLSRELLVFNSFVRSLTRALRTLLEVTSLNMLLRADARRARDDFLDIALSLPFQNDVNTGFGVLAKVYLDALTHLNGGARVTDPNAEGVKEAKEMALEICEDTFPGVKSPKAEVERGFRFWDVALTAIRTAVEGGVLPELAEVFDMADAWLKPHRP